ncbi:cytochrome P450 [Umezawaea sp. Da 62-37]|uniref:cytochrome P450 family protein n=1 Tax=Umezawaea sp. Da 62-37 TaxID=3075927 RepID=UPI0028F6CAB4|nr:cytochrome P450 [Umezawaea sp. Da 62-37]WNV84433.1 cytochrome P450 [Umezawaea sp. Da 62-37]
MHPSDRVVTITAEFKADAPARYAELRALGPVHRSRFSTGIEGWLVVGHDAALDALVHPALVKNSAPSQDKLDAANYTNDRPGIGLGGNMLVSDPPDHTRLRKLVAGAFSPARTRQLGPRVQQIADHLIDELAPKGEVDLVEAFTAPLPVAVISELLGVPTTDRANFRAWSSLSLGAPSTAQREAALNLNHYLADLIATKRHSPADDLLSALVAVHDEDDGRLNEVELVGTAVLLVVAGHETTVNLLGNTVVALLHNPTQADLLRTNPDLVPGAVEEFLRYDSSVEHATPRYATEDLVLAGTPITRGDVVMVALSSASRDMPVPHQGDPAKLDVTRKGVRHLSFGHGIHYCLGAPLARLEMTTALTTLLHRIPDLRAAVPLNELTWIPSGIMRGPLALPVRFTSHQQ